MLPNLSSVTWSVAAGPVPCLLWSGIYRPVCQFSSDRTIYYWCSESCYFLVEFWIETGAGDSQRFHSICPALFGLFNVQIGHLRCGIILVSILYLVLYSSDRKINWFWVKNFPNKFSLYWWTIFGNLQTVRSWSCQIWYNCNTMNFMSILPSIPCRTKYAHTKAYLSLYLFCWLFSRSWSQLSTSKTPWSSRNTLTPSHPHMVAKALSSVSHVVHNAGINYNLINYMKLLSYHVKFWP